MFVILILEWFLANYVKINWTMQHNQQCEQWMLTLLNVKWMDFWWQPTDNFTFKKTAFSLELLHILTLSVVWASKYLALALTLASVLAMAMKSLSLIASASFLHFFNWWKIAWIFRELHKDRNDCLGSLCSVCPRPAKASHSKISLLNQLFVILDLIPNCVNLHVDNKLHS